MASAIGRLRALVDEGGAIALLRHVDEVRDRFTSGGARVVPVANRDFHIVHDAPTRRPDSSQWRVEWLVTPVTPGSGGHTTALRLVQHLERRGHTCTLRFYDPRGVQDIGRARQILADHFPPVAARLVEWDGTASAADVVMATSWPTAWAVASARTEALRAYLIQDYEPWFYAAGSHSALAERTYELGLASVTIGQPLADFISARHRTDCRSFPFGVDGAQFRRLPGQRRTGVVFYGRPETARRGFELGCLALQIFAEERPEATIHLVGGRAAARWLPASVVQHGVVPHERLNDIYNESRIGLVLSFTNVSLLPLELLSAGCVPVMNDSALLRAALPGRQVRYSAADPASLAMALVDAWDAFEDGAEAQHDDAPPPTWEQAGDAFLSAVAAHLLARC